MAEALEGYSSADQGLDEIREALLLISEYDDEESKETLDAVLEATIFAYARYTRQTPRELLISFFDSMPYDVRWRREHLPLLDESARQLAAQAEIAKDSR